MNYKNYDLMELIELLQVQMAKMDRYYAKGWYKIWHQQARVERAIIAELERREELLTIKN